VQAVPKPKQDGQERWMPPKCEKRVKGPAPVKGQKQVVQWNPNHKFLHIRNGEPIIPFKELLKGKAGDERRRLLYEIAMDQKEWKRWQHAKAVERSDKQRRKAEAKQPSGFRDGLPLASTPQEKWKQKVAKKRARQWEEEQQERGGGQGGGASWMGRGRQSGRSQLFKK
jgi:hypothetical protein